MLTTGNSLASDDNVANIDGEPHMVCMCMTSLLPTLFAFQSNTACFVLQSNKTVTCIIKH